MSSERKKRKSKWDQTTPEGVVNSPGGVDASVSAAAAAARLNAKLEAEGKLQRQTLSSVAQNTTSLLSSKSIAQAMAGSGNTITGSHDGGTVASSGVIPTLTGHEGVSPVEIEINDSEARGTLTKGPILNEINKSTGAYISVRGRYMTPEEKRNTVGSTDQPLYLHIQGPNISFINAAVQKVRTLMREADDPDSVMKSLPNTSLLLPNVTVPSSSMTTIPGHHYLQDKVFIGITGVPDDFKLLDKLQGPGGTYLGHIASTTGAKVFLRGKGSGYLEPTSGRESFEALYVYISHPKADGLSAAKKLSENLIEHVKQELNSFQQSKVAQSMPPGYNPYYQGPPPPPQVPPGYAPPPPNAMPHPQQHIPPPPPHQAPLLMNPMAPPTQLPPIVNGGEYFNGGGYGPPGSSVPPPHLGQHPGLPPPVHNTGPTPVPVPGLTPIPVPAPIPGHIPVPGHNPVVGPIVGHNNIPGPVPSYPPPPMVGPDKPYSMEMDSEPIFTATGVHPQQHEVSIPHSVPLAPPTSSLSASVAPGNGTNIENLAYHQLPRSKPSQTVVSSAPKRKFTEKESDAPSTVTNNQLPTQSNGDPPSTTASGGLSLPRAAANCDTSTITIQALKNVPSAINKPSTLPDSNLVGKPGNGDQIESTRLSTEVDNEKTVMPPPSFNPRTQVIVAPPTKSPMPPSSKSPVQQKKRNSKNIDTHSTSPSAPSPKQRKILSLVSYGDDSDSDTDNY